MATSFHPFTNLTIILQSDILDHTLPEDPALISAFWTMDLNRKSYNINLP
jgi:hypothetical protein